MFMHRINLFTTRLDNLPQTNTDQVSILERVSTLHTCNDRRSIGERRKKNFYIKTLYFADSRLVYKKLSNESENQNRRREFVECLLDF